MKKKRKLLSLLCLAALLGVMMPVSVKAAEEQMKMIYTTDDNSAMPVIELKYQGQNLTHALAGAIEYGTYINNRDQRVSISVSQGTLTALSYYLDNSGSNESKSEAGLSSLWQSAANLYYQEVPLSQDGKYVLYVKATADNGQSSCIRTVGLVVDSLNPVITGINDGGTYPLGTKFGVEDDNLDTVLVNEQAAAPDGDGLYQVAANGNSCVIKAKDKAGHETTYSITIGGNSGGEGGNGGGSEGGNGSGGNEGGDHKDDTTVINNNGTYSLHKGTAYRLGGGSWQLDGDSVTYSGGITFYVNKDGDYTFKQQ